VKILKLVVGPTKLNKSQLYQGFLKINIRHLRYDIGTTSFSNSPSERCFSEHQEKNQQSCIFYNSLSKTDPVSLFSFSQITSTLEVRFIKIGC
jgi:hypothetical protein